VEGVVWAAHMPPKEWDDEMQFQPEEKHSTQEYWTPNRTTGISTSILRPPKKSLWRIEGGREKGTSQAGGTTTRWDGAVRGPIKNDQKKKKKKKKRTCGEPSFIHPFEKKITLYVSRQRKGRGRNRRISLIEEK